MKPGPRPKPTSIKKLQGNPGKRALPKNEPQPETPKEIPKPPSYLSDGAKKIWKDLAPKLVRLGLLTELDYKPLGIVCSVLWRHEEAEKQMKIIAKENGKNPLEGTISKSPGGYREYSVLLNMSHKSMQIALKYLAEFGMTPSSRGRIEIKKQPRKNPNKKGVLTIINGD